MSAPAPDAAPARLWPALVLLGFASGLTQPLVDSTLSAWLRDCGLSPAELLTVGYVTLPFTLKVLWAPLVDRWSPPGLGRRRGWLVLCQLAALAALVALALLGPEKGASVTLDSALVPVLVAATLLALAGATQDLVVNGYTCDVLPEGRREAGSGLMVWGYRAAWLVSGGLVLALPAEYGWRGAYLAMAALLALTLLGTWLAPEPARTGEPPSLRAAILEPLLAWRRELGWRALVLLVLFVLVYRLPDGIANLLAVPFLQEHYDLGRLGLTRGLIGLLGAAPGVLLAAWAAPRLGTRRALLVFGLLQAASNLGYLAVERGLVAGLPGLVALLFVENLCGALAATAFVAYLMGFCTSAASATQYALLTTVMLLGPHLLREPLGRLQTTLGWSGFFLASALALVPALALLPRLPLSGAKRAA